jgi:dynactin-4
MCENAQLTLAQLAKINKELEVVQNEFEAIKDHLDGYVASSNPAPPAVKSALAGRQPTRHISHLTQMAAKALGRDVPGMRSVKPRKSEADKEVKVNDLWDEMEEYPSKATWKARGLERGMSDAEGMSSLLADVAQLERRWNSSWERSRATR